jgi:protocatechuate 3,4-dioxygenase beta subunit
MTMDPQDLLRGRRRFLGSLTVGVAAFTVPGLFAEQLTPTPHQGTGPFYPDKLPLDTDNDLLIVGNSITPAVGEVTRLSGRILDGRGNPVRGALVEIWQVDRNGSYIHSAGLNGGRRDPHFQGFGRFVTGSTGDYMFRTIKPVAYANRAPHVHFAVKLKGRDDFTTQCYIKGEPLNDRDGLLRGIRDPQARVALIVPFVPIEGSRIGELSARFDIILGFTPNG